jgi:hypothetical protein
MSSTTFPNVFSPAVDFLIHQHHLSSEQISMIPRSGKIFFFIKKASNLEKKTGPKGRLLKGDVLDFMKNPQEMNQEFFSIPHAYYTTNISLKPTNIPDMSNMELLTQAILKTIKKVPECKFIFYINHL